MWGHRRPASHESSPCLHEWQECVLSPQHIGHRRHMPPCAHATNQPTFLSLDARVEPVPTARHVEHLYCKGTAHVELQSRQGGEKCFNMMCYLLAVSLGRFLQRHSHISALKAHVKTLLEHNLIACLGALGWYGICRAVHGLPGAVTAFCGMGNQVQSVAAHQLLAVPFGQWKEDSFLEVLISPAQHSRHSEPLGLRSHIEGCVMTLQACRL